MDEGGVGVTEGGEGGSSVEEGGEGGTEGGGELSDTRRGARARFACGACGEAPAGDSCVRLSARTFASLIAASSAGGGSSGGGGCSGGGCESCGC